jgi:LmbE family N-acetylglucosaminyl deacetylase
MSSMKKEIILILCAHNDDQVFGMGGTIAKYANEGKIVKTVVFSFGEQSHPHLKPEVITKMRVKESLKSDKIIGGKGVTYLGLKEGKFKEQIEKMGVNAKVRKIIEKEKPTKIFTHSINDAHHDHRAVYHFVKELTDEIKYKGDIYLFGVWSPVRIKNRNLPKMVVDVTKTFSRKIEAIKAHQSQQITIVSLLWNVYAKAIMNGSSHNCKYAEVFYKLK